MMYQVDTIKLDATEITVDTHPVYGEITVFHDVPIASEMVQQYNDGYAFKVRDELESYSWTVDGRWIHAGKHPETGIISERDQIHGRTTNPRYVKNLKDPKTKRPNRAGVLADIEVFNNKIHPDLLESMIQGKKRDVSIGFFYIADETPGEYNGVKYDYIQREMFHDHLAVAIDQGRCPAPYCGLGADEIMDKLKGDPFAGFKNFEDCVSKIMEEQNLPRENAEKICGALKSKHEDDIFKSHIKNIKALAEAVVKECKREEGVLDSDVLEKTVKDIAEKKIDAKIQEILKEL